MEEINTPLVSIIVPCYNYGHLLGETLNNILEQSYKNWECIIVDDGSSDNTSIIAKEFVRKNQQFFYVFQKNAGLSAARNTGLQHSNGSFIQLLDADDFIAENKLKRQIDLLNKFPEISIVYGEIRYFKTNKPCDYFFTLNGGDQRWMKSYTNHEQFCLELIKLNLFAVNCALFRKSIIFECGYFNEELKSVEDWEFWVRCALKNIQFFFDSSIDAIALVRVHETSMSQNLIRMIEASLIARKGLRNSIKKTKLEFKKELINANENQLQFLHRTLYNLLPQKREPSSLKNLFWGYSFLKDWRFILLEIRKNWFYLLVGFNIFQDFYKI